MTKTIRTVQAKKAAQELWGKKMLEQHKLVMDMIQEIGKLKGRVEKLENIHTVEIAKQNSHQDKMITGSKDYVTGG